MLFNDDEKLVERLEYLEGVNRYSVDILEQALKLFDFNLRDQLKNNMFKRDDFLKDVDSRVRKILPIVDSGFFLVDEDNFDFKLVYKNKSADEEFLNNEMARLVDDWAFSSALREKRTVIVGSSDPDFKILMHVMATSSRIRGMFFSTTRQESIKKIPEISLLLLSTTLLVCSNFLESIDLYEILNSHNILLEKTIEERTAALKHQADHDGLTSLPNRNYMLEKLKEVMVCETYEGLAFIKLDLNRFKDINDSYGHSTGDQALRVIASRLADSCRDEDVVGRFGGDEFAIILPGVSKGKHALNTATRILVNVEQPFTLNENHCQIDVSMGISIYPKDSENLSGIIRKADVAMYKSKRDKSGISLYSSRYDEIDSLDISIKVDLKNALENEELYPLFQPRYCFDTGLITGVEALSRWNHPVHGFVPPGKFIPVAEKSGLIKSLTGFIIKKCLLQAIEWSDKGLDIKIAANLSALDLQDEKFPGKITNIIKEFPMAPDLIEFEITESTIMTNQEQAIKNLIYLNRLGFSISLDDFGTGYSSLSYLHMFPVDNIKIDLSFVREMENKPENRKIVQTIISLGKSLGKKTVAEGVETDEVATLLRQMGCDCIQGYYIGKPMRAHEVEKIIKDNFSI